MARVSMVTRSIVSTKVSVLCMDLETKTSVIKDVVLPRTYKDDNAILKYLAKHFDNDTIKAVSIMDKVEQSDIYGMEEQEFIKLAKVLDENRKPIEELLPYSKEIRKMK